LSTPTDPTDLLTDFVHLPGSPDLSGAIALLRELDPGFTPVEVTVTEPGPTPVTFPFDASAWERILETPGAWGFEMDMGNLEEPSLSCTADAVCTEVQLAGVAPSADLLEALINAPGLILGVRGDSEDANWQGEEYPQNYQHWYDGEWEHLPRITDERGRELIDVSGNPGRITAVAGVPLWAAQDLWFGPAAALVIDHDAIPSLPVGRVTELGEGRFHVRLWEDGLPIEEVRKAQQVLRDHLGYDAATERVDEIRTALRTWHPEDPMFVTQAGSFAHGGTERTLEYLSANKHPAARSSAAWLRVTEFGEEHRKVHEEDIDLTTQPHPEIG
jgi:hypothetical protein